MKSFALLFSLFALLASADLSWSSCGSPEDALEIHSLTVSPQPQKGEPFQIQFDGKLKESIERGTKAKLSVVYGRFPIRVPDVDLCSEIDKRPEAPMKCPIPANDYKLSQSITIPSIPKGNYKVHIVVENQNSHRVTCLNVNLKL